MKPEFYNQHIEKRIGGVLDALLALYKSGAPMSSASKGTERELFVNNFLSGMFPSHFRFGSGDITDINDYKSGQVDVVVESPHQYSFPALLGNSPRLYFAETVAATIEETIFSAACCCESDSGETT